MRPSEHRHLVWPVHHLTAVATLLAYCVAPPVAATAVGYLVFGDAAAALVGRRWGRHRYGAKSLEGSAACAGICLGLGALLLPQHPAAVAAGAITATLVEALPLPFDDNWTMPLAAAAVLVALV
jgi:dolichol kinase